jgi:tRNA (guanine37-N1)-methyltransferase
MRVNIVTIFPGFFRGAAGLSIPARAAAKGLVEYRVVDLRDFTHDRHRTVDDYPFGGGRRHGHEAGAVLRGGGRAGAGGADPADVGAGAAFTHDDAVRLSLEPEITLLCGHYKDVDQRVADALATEEVSLGDFVLSGGEYAALAITDAVVRLLPGALGTHEAAAGDSFYDEGLLSPPSYTRPAEYRGLKVPDVLLSGHQARIEAWRRERRSG